MAKRRRKAPAWERTKGRKHFDLRIPGVNISISLQPTRKGVLIVKPRVSRVTISRGRENPLQPHTTPGRSILQRVGTTTRSFR